MIYFYKVKNGSSITFYDANDGAAAKERAQLKCSSLFNGDAKSCPLQASIWKRLTHGLSKLASRLCKLKPAETAEPVISRCLPLTPETVSAMDWVDNAYLYLTKNSIWSLYFDDHYGSEVVTTPPVDAFLHFWNHHPVLATSLGYVSQNNIIFTDEIDYIFLLVPRPSLFRNINSYQFRCVKNALVELVLAIQDKNKVEPGRVVNLVENMYKNCELPDHADLTSLFVALRVRLI